MSEMHNYDDKQILLTEEQALGFAANVLRTLATTEPADSASLVRAARILDDFFLKDDDEIEQEGFIP